MARNRFWPVVIYHASNCLCSLIVATFFGWGRNKYNNQIISLTKLYPIWGKNKVYCPRYGDYINKPIQNLSLVSNKAFECHKFLNKIQNLPMWQECNNLACKFASHMRWARISNFHFYFAERHYPSSWTVGSDKTPEFGLWALCQKENKDSPENRRISVLDANPFPEQ